MSKLPTEDRDYELWVLLTQARAALSRARRKELHRHNITTRQSAVLFVIQAIGGKATPGEIARWLLREPHSISELLSRMEKDGLVRKIKGLDKKNVVRIVLTEKGRKAYDKSVVRESIHEIMSSLSEEERQQLRSCLQKLRDKALSLLAMEQVIPFPPS